MDVLLESMHIATLSSTTISICLERGLVDFYCNFLHESSEGLVHGLFFLDRLV